MSVRVLAIKAFSRRQVGTYTTGAIPYYMDERTQVVESRMDDEQRKTGRDTYLLKSPVYVPLGRPARYLLTASF
jgi:hypothetical protein